jgi:hypothetical protein
MTNDDIVYMRLLADWHDRQARYLLLTQTLWAEKIQSTTDAGSLNTFSQNEIEVAPISSVLLRIACLVILYKTCRVPVQAEDRYERSTT